MGGANFEDQFRLHAATAGGLRQPDDVGIESNVIERFAGAGVPAEKISFARDTFTFNYPCPSRRSWMNSENINALLANKEL
jgi:hypothetical protein